MKKIEEYRIVANLTQNDRLYLLRISPAAHSARIEKCEPGQFVEIRVENDPSVFLRRPISIHRVDYEANIMELLIQKAGRGTNRLATLKEGDLLNIVYPLGHGFTIASNRENYLLVGGGVGIAPLLELGIELNNHNKKVTFLLGGRTANDLVRIEEYAKYGTVWVTTEDGSTIDGYDCQKGFVTQHTGFKDGVFDAVRVCGPLPMMKAVGAKVSTWKRVQEPDFCEVSLENKMACGLGVCLCCVEDTKEGNLCVCKDGPVFDINRLKW